MVESPGWDWPFIVLSPVLPTNNWHPRSAQVDAIFDYAVNNLGGDPNRLYLTGLSHGGAGTLAIGIELADRLAALMPVTPGGDADNYNWEDRAAIATIPTLFIIGTDDGEYDNTLGWAMDLEASGAPPFSHYSLPASDEHNDSIPMTALGESHVFVSYQNLPHDIWHAAYGTFCEVLTAQKTVQYNWLLTQSLNGEPFVDPRTGMVPGGVGGAPGTGGAPPAAGAGGDSAGAPPLVDTTGGTGGMPVAAPPSTAGTPATPTTPAQPANTSGGGSSSGCAVLPESTRFDQRVGLLALGAALWLGRRRRRRSPPH
jgi:hypothetical protein